MEELELTPISSMFEEQEEVQEEVQPSIFDDIEEVKEEEKEAEESPEEEVDLTSVKTLYNHWKEFLPFDEVEEPTVEFLREQQEKLPEKFFMSYVETRSPVAQDLLAYESKLQNSTVEDLKKFFDQYLDVQEVSISTNEEAREYLKNQPEFKKMYKSEEKINQALDILEDDNELIERAKELEAERNASKEEAKKQKLQELEAEKNARINREKEFASLVNKEIESLPWKPEKKREIISSLNPKFISDIWADVQNDPKALPQFIDFFKHYKKGEAFDAFYKLIEGKEQSKEVTKVKSNIEKDSLGKLLGKHASHESKNVRSLAEDFG